MTMFAIVVIVTMLAVYLVVVVVTIASLVTKKCLSSFHHTWKYDKALATPGLASVACLQIVTPLGTMDCLSYLTAATSSQLFNSGQA